jgi:pimeloyl-ACP methyl ester carboxylesterase
MTNLESRPAWVSGGADVPDTKAREYTVTTPDGRTLGVAEYGPEDGSPIVGIHGTPGCRYGGPPPEKPDLYDRLGVRSILFDRPGYGLSTRRPGRKVADVADDVRAIVDHLGIDRFAVTGGSGGGPRSLAVATLLADRVTRAACVVGVAPFGEEGLPQDEWLEGMTQGNVDEFRWALEGEESLIPNLQRLAAEELPRVKADPSNPFGEEYELSDGDREIMSRPAYHERMIRMIQESYRTGVFGWVDDNLTFVRPWGFNLADLRVPTTVWFGVDDTLVPAAHGEWLAAHTPGVSVVRMYGGHMELTNRVEDLVQWLVDGDMPSDATST